MDIEAKQNALGGGAINEKPRVYNTNNDPIVNGKDRDISNNSWNPSDELSHMLHALVGLDRYPNYLSRFQHFSDINSLEKALEARLSDVRRQKSEIAERRADIRQLVRGYILSESEGDLGKDSYNCSELWCDHPLLSPPKTWTELREKKVLTDQAFKVCYRSIDSTSNARKAKSKKRTNSLPTLEDIIHGKVQVHLDPSLLEEWMNQEMYDVYSFPLLTNEVRKHGIFFISCLLKCNGSLTNYSSFAVFFAKQYVNCPFSQSPTNFLTSNSVAGQSTLIRLD